LKKERLSVVSARLEMFIYPTEDREKALAALINLVPPEVRNRLLMKRESFRSHYGYSLEKIRIELSGNDAKAFAKYLEKLSGSNTIQEIIQTLETRTDDRNLYLRVSKQAAYGGRVELYAKDPGGQIRIKITYSSNYLPKGGLIRAIREKGIGVSE